MQNGFSRLTANLTPAVKWLIGAVVATLLVFTFSGAATQGVLLDWMLLTPAALLHGHVWKLVTTAFVPQTPIFALLDILLLWMFMPFFEREWGTRRFVRFGLISLLVGHLIGCGVGLLIGQVGAPIASLGAFTYAAIVAFGTAYGRQQVSFFGAVNMTGRALAIGFVVLVVVATLFQRTWVAGAANLGGMLAGWIMTTRRFTPRLWWLQWKRDRIRRRYTVLDGGAGRKSEKKWLN
jgi:membrane associated rhomboid family serine protease